MEKTESDEKDTEIIYGRHKNFGTLCSEVDDVDNVVDVDGWIFKKPKETEKIENVMIKSPVDRNSEVYNMNHKRRGKAIIFNHINFKKMAKRVGGEHDSKNLSATLSNLGFDVDVHEDPTLQVISEVLHQASAEDHADADCLVIAAMSHGESGYLYSADSMYSVDILWAPFTASRCPTLAGKPKLFFIQACRGSRLDYGIEMHETDSRSSSYSIPNCADIFIAYSTFDGYYSWRNPDKGSWFIQALCEELDKNGGIHDLLRIMTSVIRHVAIDYQSFVPHIPKMHQKKQLPSIVSMLTRLVYFSKQEPMMVQ